MDGTKQKIDEGGTYGKNTASLLPISIGFLNCSRDFVLVASQLILKPVAPGTTLQDPSHEMLFASTKISVAPELAKECSECEAPYGLPCVGTSKPNKERGEEDGRMRRRKRPHDIRRGKLPKRPKTPIESARV